MIDAVVVGDRLLHHWHLTLQDLAGLALDAPWRDGADEARWIIDQLDGRPVR
ncbi:MAG: hypothetical protein WB797_15290 [Nocardioides sp.]